MKLTNLSAQLLAILARRQLPFFPDSEDAYPDILDLPGKREWK